MKFFLTFLIVLCYSGFLEGVKFRCDYKYTNIGWFKYHAIPATWRDARLQCQLEGGILASPISAEMKSEMKKYACKVDILTGIHATFSKGQFYSVDGIPLAEIRHEWAENEPDNKNNAESCLAMDYDGKLSDVSCDEPRSYLCYRKNSNVDVNVCGTPDPGYRYYNRTNTCYKFHTEARTFDRAYFACSAEGGHLAIINSAMESEVVRDIYASYPSKDILGNFWKENAFVGFHSWNEGTDWRTIFDQSIEEAGFRKFSAGEPNNYKNAENCGSVARDGLLNDLFCHQESVFICEKKPDYPAVCDSADEKSFSSIPACADQEKRTE